MDAMWIAPAHDQPVDVIVEFRPSQGQDMLVDQLRDVQWNVAFRYLVLPDVGVSGLVPRPAHQGAERLGRTVNTKANGRPEGRPQGS